MPLPPALWQLLPGRAFVVSTLGVLGQDKAWLPLSLSPADTRAAAMALLVPLAGFFAMLSVPPRRWPWIGFAIVGCALVSLLLGLAMRVPQGAWLRDVFGTEHSNEATGTFANRNFFAAQLYTSIPLLAAVVVSAGARWRLHPVVQLGFVLVYGGFLLTGLAMTASRAGIVLAMASVLVTAAFVFRRIHQSGRPRALGGVVAAIGALVLVAQVSMIGLLRFAAIDPLTDMRGRIYAITTQAVRTFFPAGTGFGTFVPVYQRFETPDAMVASYVNHAHNDWLELILNGGAPLVVLLLAFLVLVGWAAIAIGRQTVSQPAQVFQRAALLAVALLMVHSLVDYPLRTPALLALFGVCCGFLVANALVSRAPSRRVEAPAVPEGPATFRPAQRGFKTPPRADV